MRTPATLVAVFALVLVAAPWSAGAGDTKSVDERVTALEQRVAALDQDMVTLKEVLFHARLSANEAAAIATLRNFMGAQAQFQAAAVCDEDQDGVGEYGGLAELTGSAAGRMHAKLAPPVLHPAFAALNANGETERNGYLYRIYLATKAGAGTGEPAKGFARNGGHDVNLSETVWCGYAWPARHGLSGKRTFFINQEGDVLATEESAYSGTGAGPAPDAAFTAANRIAGATALGTAGADGNRWERVD